MSEFEIKDSGVRQEFAGGMVRDTTAGKLDWWRLLVGPMARRLVAHVTKGAVKYPDTSPGVPNWTLAEGQAELARFKDSAFRHFVQWYNNESDEDHAAAVVFNINGAEYVRERVSTMAKVPTTAKVPDAETEGWLKFAAKTIEKATDAELKQEQDVEAPLRPVFKAKPSVRLGYLPHGSTLPPPVMTDVVESMKDRMHRCVCAECTASRYDDTRGNR